VPTAKNGTEQATCGRPRTGTQSLTHSGVPHACPGTRNTLSDETAPLCTQSLW
jgi:hypothetical protein